MKTGNPIANEEDFQKVANKVSTITIIGNIALSLLKLFAGDEASCNNRRTFCISEDCRRM